MVAPLLLLSGGALRASPEYLGKLAPLVYHGRPLTEVIEDVQRYVHRRIRVDAAAAEFQYSGIVKPEDIDAWLRDLPTIYPLEVVDCHVTGLGHEVSACVDPQLLLIRSRISPQYNLRTASR
jgi:hypothetical protein